MFTVILMLAFGISGMMYFIMDGAQLHYKVAAGDRISQKTNLDIIKMPLKDLKAQAGANELWHDGKLYDISSYVVVGDTAFVSVFHDGDEESLVKNIVASFETGNEFCPDNGQHISKHKLHVPNDGKILAAQYSTSHLVVADEISLVPYFLYYGSVTYTTVIKPPPRIG